MLWSMLWVALFGLLAGLLIWYWVTRPVKRLTREVAGLEHDSMSAIRALAVQQPDVAAKDEVALLRNNFIELARKITTSGISWPTATASAGSLSPIFPTTYARR